ncbi:hypothetical protein [Salininema proteolyticum]|uniref:Glycerophosphoryl diester phosphodiesterase membrane domain-containing protein n=1 Tax=Salininema proteolyticum TaxID=1607685 RepID=A0ABV8TTJ9_9ACTN
MSDNPYWSDDDPQRFESRSDPLVTDTFSRWWDATLGVLGRSWRSMGIILLIGVAIPAFILNLISTFSIDRRSTYDFGDAMSGNAPEVDPGSASGLGLLGLVTLFLFAGSAMAAHRTAAAEAAGGFTTTSEALRGAFRKCWKLWLWMILGSVCVTVGFVLLVIPGLLVSFGLALMIPVATFQKRANPFGESFRLTFGDFGPALGRLVIAVLVYLVITCVLGIFTGFLSELFLSFAPVAVANVLIVVLSALYAVVSLIPTMWMLAAVLTTYASARGKREPVSAASLSAEAAETVA